VASARLVVVHTAAGGGWPSAGDEERDDGTPSMPYAVLSKPAAAFVEALIDGQVVVAFDWSGWMQRRGEHRLATST
jgi:hypothetical protein